jgi:hypothetical protein
MHRAQKKRAQLLRAAKLQEGARIRQFANRILRLPETAVKPVFELGHRDVRRVAVVETRERQGKLGAKFVQRHLRAAGLGENEIGRLQNGGQIVHQGAGPVKDDVANHETNLTTEYTKYTKTFPSSFSSSKTSFDYENEDDDEDDSFTAFQNLKLET